MKKLLALVVLAALMVPTVATATHINEPTTPITGVELLLWEYQGKKLNCDIVDTAPFRNLRIEPYVNYAGPVSSGNPSEHFMVRIQVFTIGSHGTTPRHIPGNDSELAWSATWKHQNIPPHGAVNPNPLGRQKGNWLASESNHYDLQEHLSGDWGVIVLVIGQESGNTFTKACRFRALPLP